ncbi:MAG: hypothetical protein IV090_15990 [Candidatus Sericytochromatia bacterium]|nr:hypothetical protein [Candidatus Sericytochromatia bacterium]
MQVNRPVTPNSQAPVSEVPRNQPPKAPEKEPNVPSSSTTPSAPTDTANVKPVATDGMTADASGKIQEAKLGSEIGNVLGDNENDDIGQLKDAMHKAAEEFGPEVGEKMFNKLFIDPKSSAEYDKGLAEAAKKYKELKKSDPAAAETFKKDMACKMCEKINKTKNGEDDPGC